MDMTWSEGFANRKSPKKSDGHDFIQPQPIGSMKSMSASAPSLPQIGSRPNTVGGDLMKSSSSPMLAGGRQVTALQKGKDLRLAAFLDRQLNHPGIEAKKAMSALQRKIVSDGVDEDCAGFWGNKGVEGFRVYLRKKYGSVVAGWRVLDQDKNGRLSFYEFCNACRVMGYHGNLKKLWKDLDANANGFISLMEIDPEVGKCVGTFKMALMKKYGDMLTAWKKGLDKDGTGRIEEREIVICVQDLGLDLNPKKLYSFLRSSPGGLGLTLADFDPDAHKRAITGDLKGLMSGPNKEFIEDLPGIISREISTPLDILEHPKQGGVAQFRQEQNDADRREVRDKSDAVTKMKCGLHTAAGFKAALISRCGGLFAAWKEHLDLDGNGRLTFGEFTQALSHLGFHGDVKGLWKQLDSRGMGHIMFGDIDKVTDDALNDFREKLSKEYGNMLLGWLKGLDVRGSNLVDETVFVRCCVKVGFGMDSPSHGVDGKKLFRLLQPEAGRKFLTLKDFDTRAYQALSRGDFRMISENDEPEQKRPMDMTFAERQESGFFFQIRRAWDTAKRQEFAKACQMAGKTDAIEDKEGFNHLIIRKYGSIISAWRNCLDNDHNGKLTFNEFCGVVRWLGYSGDLKILWKSYDKDNKGYILLRDLDAEADNHVSALLGLLNARYGDLDNAWKNGFNKDPHDSIDEKELAEACDSLGYPHDPHKLFKCLQGTPGRALITIWDLDPAESRKRAQGKDGKEVAVHLNSMVPKSPTSKPPDSRCFGNDMELDEDGMAIDNGLGGPHNISTTSVSTTAFRAATPDMSGTIKNMRYAVKKKHGSTVAAWRAHFDPELTGSCSFGKFVIVVSDCGFHGNVKCLWAELSGEKTTISFRDLDPNAAGVLDEAREALLDCGGNILKAWHTMLDPAGVVRVDEENFLNQMLGKVKSPKKLFRLILARQGQRSVIVEDLEALLITVPCADRKQLWGGSVEPQNEDTRGSRPASAVRPKSGSRGGHSSTVPGVPEESAREFVNKQTKQQHAGDRICSDLATFKKILVVKYGSLFAAWRKGLDVDQNGVVTQRDFANACQRLGVKAVSKIWTEFDKNGDGQISMHEVDEETADLFNPFEQMLIEKFGSTKKGWRQVFDREKSLRCDKDKFISQCKAAGLPGNAERLFQLLRPEPGRPFLNYDDIWIDVNINDFPCAHEPNNTQGSPRSARSPSRPDSPH